MDSETSRNNEMIAQFMGWEYLHDYDKYVVHNIKDYPHYAVDDMPLHESWDWLMPVVDNIESLGYFVMINKWTSVYTGTMGDLLSISTVEGHSKIVNTYKAVVNFIQWYNEQPETDA